MDPASKVRKCYKILKGFDASVMTPLPRSGSDRTYFRIDKIIGVHGSDVNENEAFIGFARHFSSLGLRVPRIVAEYPDEQVYFTDDLGDLNLFTWLENRRNDGNGDGLVEMYRDVLDNLALFQFRGIKGLNLDLCYPHRSFSKKSMMWDLNYFKYMFLKLAGARFNESRLEDDFEKLVSFLEEAGTGCFLYRDFQSANIMIRDESPWFIDFQGGREGAPQYDVASLLFDSKALLTNDIRQELLQYYLSIIPKEYRKPDSWFMKYYYAFALIRVMQAMGAYGLRGLVEKKPGFAESIMPAINDIEYIAKNLSEAISVPEILRVVREIRTAPGIMNLSGGNL